MGLMMLSFLMFILRQVITLIIFPKSTLSFFDTTTLLLPLDKIVNKYVQYYNHYQAG